ncbi:nucleoid-associated protein YejK [Halomonas sp. MCCC 1A17488]|uniref:nucleoid-associated protein YejK n=1 Tax=unclassified Halomonas TaxID=2609666 RepID=UPI0018D238E0|nr:MULTISPECIES: nucleoid-associated protein YejK [unclassified Halomonas]MCE8015579.1 nucleoid-associated protein YejK [Halomonas sp. MCCC 1A17488]MCG3238912.1 nucleoid-associated protein YejK [Halomonas sp. MCCC 1A17488]QPP51132.1 nucleoid-associated protein YejK [Halomonas sp. SS10-MC5]
MPIQHCIVHAVDKAGSDQPARLSPATAELAPSALLEELLARFHDAYHAKTKAWGHFVTASDDQAESAAGLAPALADYLDGKHDFAAFTRGAAERLLPVVDAHLSVSGHLLCVDYHQGETHYLALALLHQREGFGVGDSLQVVPATQLNLARMSLGLRINLTQWREGAASRHYLSWIHDRGGKKLSEDLAGVLGATEGIDATGETRTLLKAFSDYVEREDMPEEQSREKTEALIDYANEQAGRGEPITLEELSELLDEQQPKAFYDHIRNADYGLSPEIPPDKRTLRQFRRFTGRAGGMSISFDSHLLGSSIEYDESQDRLIIKQLPKQLKEQLKKRQG